MMGVPADNVEKSPGGLAAEWTACWRRLPEKLFFFGLLAAWLGLFHFLGNSTLGYLRTPSLLLWMKGAYDTPVNDDGHGNLIPFVVLGLFWWRREELLAVSKRLWPPALALLVVAVLLHVAGYVVQQPRVSVVALFAGIYALMGLAWGAGVVAREFFSVRVVGFLCADRVAGGGGYVSVADDCGAGDGGV